MKFKKIIISLISLFLTLVFAGYAAAKEVSFSGESGEPGDTVTVSINVDDVSGIVGYNINFSYDSTVLLATGASVGADMPAGVLFIPNVNNPDGPGTVRLTMGGFMAISDTGPGELASITFNILGNAYKNGSLNFTMISLKDEEGGEIAGTTSSDSAMTVTGVEVTVAIAPVATTDVVVGQGVTLVAEILVNGAHLDATDANDITFASSGNGTFGAKALVGNNVQVVYTAHTTLEEATITATEGVTGNNNQGTATVSSVADEVNAANSTVSANPTAGVTVSDDGSSFSTVTVTLKDQYNNPVSGKTVNISLTGTDNFINGAAYTAPVNLTTQSNAAGVVTFQLSSTKAESKTVTAKVGDTTITQTANVAFVAAGFSPGMCTVETSAGSVTTDGGATADITVTVRDAFGNPVSGAAVTLEATGSNNTIGQPAATTDAAGQTTGTIASTRAEAKTVTANIGTTAIGTVGVTFTPGAAANILLSSNKPTIVNNGTDVVEIYGTILDQNGNIVTGYDANDVTFTVDNVGLASFNGNATGTVLTGNIANGVATINLNSVETDDVGQVQITAASNGVNSAVPLTIDVINKILVSISIETVAGGLVNNTSPRVGETVQLRATGHYRLPGEEVDPALDEDITNVATWNSSVAANGTVSAAGLFRALVEGTTNVTATMDTITSNALAMNVQAAAEVVIDDTNLPTTIVPGTEIDFGAVTSGGTGAGFTYAVDSQPAGNRGSITADGKFNVATDGAFAGVYVVSVTDDNSGASTTYQVTVPLIITPSSKNLLAGQSFDLVVSGAAPGAQIGDESDLLDQNGNSMSDEEIDEIATFNPAEPPFVFDGDSKATIEITAKSVAELAMFRANLIVENDPALTDENGLNQITSGWIRILPGVTYSGLVQDDTGNPIDGAKVLFALGSDVKAEATTAANGRFEVAGLISPVVTTSEYNVIITAAGFLTRTDITTLGWTGERDDPIELEAQPVDGRTVTGTVTEALGPVAGATISCNVDGAVFIATSANDGTYTLALPAIEDTAGLMVRASKDGYLAQQKAFAATVDFDLAPVDPADPADVNVGEDGGSFTKTFTEGDVKINIPAGALPANSVLTITPLPVGESTDWTENSVALFLIEIRDAVTGDEVDLQEPIQITIPFDTTRVNPGDFRNGIAVIYHAVDQAALEAGLGERIPTTDIIFQDDVAGEVTFWVDDLSVFGIGIAPPAAGGPDAVLSGSSGCFIDTTAAGLKPGVALVMLGLLLGGAVFSRFFVKTARK